jgi:hypothetical protein
MPGDFVRSLISWHLGSISYNYGELCASDPSEETDWLENFGLQYHYGDL